MNFTDSEQRFDTVVIGGGQAGLAAGYYLAMQGRDFVILDAHNRIGVSWRKRWDRLRLFTPAWISSLPEMPLSVPVDAFLTKDEVADYLEAYAARFHLPLRLNAVVNTLTREGDRYLLTTGDHRLQDARVLDVANVIWCLIWQKLASSFMSNMLCFWIRIDQGFLLNRDEIGHNSA